MKKITVTLVICLVTFFAIGATSFAATDPIAYPSITFEDSNDFTIVKDPSVVETLKAMGLTASWNKSAFTSDEIQYLTWRTSDPSVIKFNYWGFFSASTLRGREEVKLKTVGSGNATITVTYNPPNGNPVSVSSYVVVENGQVISNISGVTTKVTGTVATTQLETTKTIPLFSLKDIYGNSFDDSDVLKCTPTAIHAILYNLELKNDPDNAISINDPSWDWDWVQENVTITSQGSYINGISPDIASGTTGWQYSINGVDGTKSSSVVDLSNGINVHWDFKAFSW